MESEKAGPQIRHLKKGDLLFSEGDHSTAMYLVKGGMVRLFMSRSGNTVEIATIRSGEILGELAFLDGNPRSVSGEALTDCELIEISAPVFKDVLSKAPDWMKILLKTVVGRLRAVNTRIRQLEVSQSRGKGGGSYQYLPLSEIMKIITAFTLVVSKNPEKGELGISIDLDKASFYSSQIMGVPVAKTTSVIDVLIQVDAIKAREEKGVLKAYLQEINFLEELNLFLYDESQRDPAKRKDVSVRGFLILDLIMVELLKAKPEDIKDLFSFDIGALRKQESDESERKAFRNDDVSELFLLGYLAELEIKSNDEVKVAIQPEVFKKQYRFLKVIMAVRLLNEQKRKLAGVSK